MAFIRAHVLLRNATNSCALLLVMLIDFLPQGICFFDIPGGVNGTSVLLKQEAPIREGPVQSVWYEYVLNYVEIMCRGERSINAIKRPKSLLAYCSPNADGTATARSNLLDVVWIVPEKCLPEVTSSAS